MVKYDKPAAGQTVCVSDIQRDCVHWYGFDCTLFIKCLTNIQWLLNVQYALICVYAFTISLFDGKWRTQHKFKSISFDARKIH